MRLLALRGEDGEKESRRGNRPRMNTDKHGLKHVQMASVGASPGGEDH